MDRLLLATAVVLLGLSLSPTAEAINCYTCSSHNGSDPACEDPFHPAHSYYSQKCMVPKMGHIGVFPANFCIKLIGTNVDTSELMVIRACVRKTMDSQCGSFRYQDNLMNGCILTCDYDGCNSARGLGPQALLVAALAALLAVTLAT
ncbi:U-scoloptoxin(05)-Sm1a-like [Thrips palmi]|uniref:U-scoloptoxin(05)-Sm1a-like n=1 Tax=Thrips palmi TaxID=161013 RepID=A0A6P8YR84_THRPL|nr:U-scoloptoxin(05)-Sm1a-like [Thrips palmi]